MAGFLLRKEKTLAKNFWDFVNFVVDSLILRFFYYSYCSKQKQTMKKNNIINTINIRRKLRVCGIN